nr:hypothetical protein IXTSGTPV_IXTSGTPV_CDS_0003 [Microvirus sp.]
MDDYSYFPLCWNFLILYIIIMNKYFLPMLFMFACIFMLISCKSVGGYYIRHGSGYVCDTLHYRLTFPNNSNINLINP